MMRATISLSLGAQLADVAPGVVNRAEHCLKSLRIIAQNHGSIASNKRVTSNSLLDGKMARQQFGVIRLGFDPTQDRVALCGC